MKKLILDEEHLQEKQIQYSCKSCGKSQGSFITLNDTQEKYHPMCAWLEGIKFQIYYHEDEELRREYLKPSKFEHKYVRLCRDDFLPDQTHCNSYFGEAPSKTQED